MPAPKSPEELRREIARLERRVAELETQQGAGAQLVQGDRQHGMPPMLDELPAMVWVTDADLRLTWWTGGAVQALEADPDSFIGTDLFTYLGTDDREAAPIAAHLRAVQGQSVSYDQWINGVCFTAHLEPKRDAEGAITGVIGVAIDITRRMQAEQDRVRLIDELQQALDRVKRLSGLIPICMHCKSVRDDDGYWQQVETFVRQHSNAEFSHSICPGCMDGAMAELEYSGRGPSAPAQPPTRTRTHHDLRRRTLREEEDPGSRARDGLRRDRRGRPDRVPARQPDLVLPVAEHHPALRVAGTLHRARPDRHGRFPEAPGERPRPLHVRGSRAPFRRHPRRAGRHRERDAGDPRLGLGAGLRLGVPPPGAGQGHRVHGRHRVPRVLGRLARRRHPALPELPARPRARR